MNRSKIVVLGLCAKKDPRGGVYPPLGPTSRSGKFVRSVVAGAVGTSQEVVFDNILSSCVFDTSGAERNPVASELVAPLQSHWFLNDRLVRSVVALGAEARKAFEVLPEGTLGNIRVCFLPHPSYVMRRPRGEREAFVRDLRHALGAGRDNVQTVMPN